MSTSKPKPISDRTWQGRQSWNREVIELVGTKKVRYTIKVDSYDFQSYGLAEVWKDNMSGWSQVHRIPGPQLRTRASYVTANVKPSAFDEDLKELRSVAAAVLT